ncbi:MAG TPA: ABC transporter ATP-binding protein [Solirubrobacteraceae bacterium]|jgi:ABC-2 type transport system ATP-binding protein|nr:ABC transporter ATP-binding protein [Solirubrobacteraceae bacterium]
MPPSEPGPRSQPWFVRRRYGFGYRPLAWQGWAIAGAMVAVVIVVVVAVHASAARIAVIAALAVSYTAVAWRLSGERADVSGAVEEEESASPAREPVGLTSEQSAAVAALRAEAATTAVRRGPAEDEAIAVEGLTKRFGERTALSDVSFSVGWGEVFGFLGPNGAGKTTTVRTLGTLISPSGGSAFVAGLALTPENAVAIRSRIAIMPEAPGLYPRLTVAENLEFFGGLYGLADVRPRIEQALSTVNLAERAGDMCGSLSKGLKQRVAIARALLSDPRVLFLDEPTSGLDPVASREVHELISALRERGVTIFLTTHRLEEAERMCDRVAILNTTLRTVGRPDELRERLFAHSLAVTTVAPLDAPERVFAAVPGIGGWRVNGAGGYELTVSDPRAAAPALTRELVAAGADVLSIGERRHSLEDVYLELIDEDVEAKRS